MKVHNPEEKKKKKAFETLRIIIESVSVWFEMINNDGNDKYKIKENIILNFQ
jgi:hypothetical protein